MPCSLCSICHKSALFRIDACRTIAAAAGGELITPDPVPVDIAARGWQPVMDLEAGNWQLQAAIRTLSAAARSSPKPLARDLATAVGIVMGRATEVNPLEAPGSCQPPLDRCLLVDAMTITTQWICWACAVLAQCQCQGRRRGSCWSTGKRAAEEVGALKQIAIAATRVAAEPRAALTIGRSNLRQVASADPVTARHALGLAINVARKVSTPWSALHHRLQSYVIVDC